MHYTYIYVYLLFACVTICACLHACVPSCMHAYAHVHTSTCEYKHRCKHAYLFIKSHSMGCELLYTRTVYKVSFIYIFRLCAFTEELLLKSPVFIVI